MLPISEKQNEYAGQVLQSLKGHGMRATVDVRSSKVNGKIRDAQLELIPYMLVVGQKEADEGTVTIRDRLDAEHQQTVPVSQAIAMFQAEIRERRIRQSKKPLESATAVGGQDVEENAY